MQTIYLDISNRGVIPTIYAKQGDVGRKFRVTIFDSGIPYDVGDKFLSAWYSGDSGDGNYTEIGSEKSAFARWDNIIEVELIQQMLSVPGNGNLCIVLSGEDGAQIASWNIPYICEEVPGFGSDTAKEYYTAFSKAVESLRSNPENISIDDTLSIPGAAADSSATGKLISSAHTALSDRITEITYPSKLINDNDADFNTVTNTGDYTVTINNALNNPLNDVLTNSMCILHVRTDLYKRYIQYVHPLYGTATDLLLYMRIGSEDKVTNSPVWMKWTKIETDITTEKLGLGNVDNTSDMDKPVSIAQAELFDTIGTSVDTLWSKITEINTPTKKIPYNGLTDFDLITETGDYTVTVNNAPNNPLTGKVENDLCKLIVRADNYGRRRQIVHPLYGVSSTTPIFFRVGATTNGETKWDNWVEVLTSDNPSKWGIWKTIVNIGDSIFGLHDWKSISYQLEQFSGATVYNCAFGGTSVIENTGVDYTIPFHFENLAKAICGEITVEGSEDPWASQKSTVDGMAEDTDGQKYTKERYQNHLNNIMSVDFANVDVLTIAYGTNDWARGYYGGTPPTLAEVVSTLESGIKKINAKYPKVKILLICPIWRWWDSKDSDITDYGTGTLEDFSVEYDKLAKKLKIPYLDAYHNLTFNVVNYKSFYEDTDASGNISDTDATHLNSGGRKMYAELLDGKLKTLF